MRLIRTAAALTVTGALLTAPFAANAAAPTALPQKVAGKTLIVSIYGLTSDASGKVVVKGPNGYKKVVRGQGARKLSGLTPGSYRLTAKPVQASGATAKPQTTKRTVTVKAKKGARATFMYVVPGTS